MEPEKCQELPPTVPLQETIESSEPDSSSVAKSSGAITRPNFSSAAKSSGAITRPKNSMLNESFISQLSTLSVSAVAAELQALGAEEFTSSFMENRIDGDAVIAFIKDEILKAMLKDLGVHKQPQQERLVLHFSCLFMQPAASQEPRASRILLSDGHVRGGCLGESDEFGLDAWLSSNQDKLEELQEIASREQQPIGPDLTAALKRAGVLTLPHRHRIEKYLRADESERAPHARRHGAKGGADPPDVAGQDDGLQQAVAAVLAERAAQKKKEHKEDVSRVTLEKATSDHFKWQVHRQVVATAAGQAKSSFDSAAEMARCKATMGTDCEWIAFSPHTAHWLPISIDPTIKSVYSTVPKDYKPDGISGWVSAAGSCLHNYIMNQIVESAKRAACFRALGRGWIFTQLSSGGGSRGRHGQADYHERYHNRSRFRWWFETVHCVANTRQDEIAQFEYIDGLDANWYLHGTDAEKEQVFMQGGARPHSTSYETNPPPPPLQKHPTTPIHREAPTEPPLAPARPPRLPH